MIINEDTWVLNEYQQWLNKVGANLILVAAQRLVLTVLVTPELKSTSPQFLLRLSWAAANTSSNQEMARLRSTTAGKKLAGLWFTIHHFGTQNQFWVAAGDAKCFFFQEAQNSWSGGGWVFLVWKQKTVDVDVDVDESVQWLFCSNTGSLSKQRRLCCRRLQRLLHVSLVTSGDLCSFLFSLVRSGDVLQFLWQSTF